MVNIIWFKIQVLIVYQFKLLKLIQKKYQYLNYSQNYRIIRTLKMPWENGPKVLT